MTMRELASRARRFGAAGVRLARSRRARRALAVLALLAALPWLLLIGLAAATPFPAPLRRPAAEGAGLRVVDRHARTIRVLRDARGQLSEHVALDEVAPTVPAALIAAEDARFRYHPGLDPVAIVRAAASNAWHGRVVSGASTITQQLARTLFVRPRTLGGKLREMALALRIEASLSKAEILEAYLERVEFGPNLRGIAAASRHYFDKPPSELDLAESATLAAIPRGPTLYDPARGLERVRRRRDRILERMRERGLASEAAIDHALAEPLTLHRGLVEGGAWQFVRELAEGKLEPELVRGEAPVLIRSTIDLDLQARVEELVRRTAARLEAEHATAAAALVVDNASGEVLAYVGSPDFFDAGRLGQNDGVTALRQPGSTLKPFVYAVAMKELGYDAATLLPDIPLELPTGTGTFAPRNYDGIFHGPVRLREALASSLNVPAAFTASRVGPEHVLALLRALGFASLDRDAAHYGVALALGDGEVRLTELAGAYATLARGGMYLPLRFARSAELASGRLVEPTRAAPARVIDADLAAILTDVLSDAAARIGGFGVGSVLELPFPAAVKTGTSKGYRDNWAVGFTRERTVAVWVGNFDGSPMHGSSGVTGAGPLLHAVLLAAMSGKEPAPLVLRDGLVRREVCTLSGELAGPDCPHHAADWFRAGRAPTGVCAMHERVLIEPESGLRAGPACAGASERVFERYPARFAAWAATARRPVAPEAFAARCPGGPVRASGALAVTYPVDGARFVLDPGVERSAQTIVLRAQAPGGARGVTFVVDGRSVGRAELPYRLSWALTPGTHRLHVEDSRGERSELVSFSVR